MIKTAIVALREKLSQYASLVLFLLALALLMGILARGEQLDMHKNVHARLSCYAFPCAVSMLYHEGPPYVIYEELPRVDSDQSYQQAIQHTLRSPEKTWLFPADDKGMVDLVLLAVLLFGPTIAGLFYTTILILGATVMTFFAAFYHRPSYCLMPLVLLSGIFVTMPSFLLTNQVGSFTNNRVFELFGLIPAAHVMLTIIDRSKLTWTNVLALAFQTLVIMECIHVRCTAMWIVAGIFLVYFGLLTIVRCGFIENVRSAAVLKSSWVLAVLLIGVMALKGYQRAIYPTAYNSTKLQHRVLWHNVGMGFALHPKLADEYKLDTSYDRCMIALIKKRLIEKNDEARIDQIWGKPGDRAYLLWHGIAYDFQAYEEEARAAVFAMMCEHPGRILELFLFYKPRVALRTFLWAAGLYPRDLDALYIPGQGAYGCIPKDEEIAQRRLRIRLDDLGLLAFLLTSVCFSCRISALSLVKVSPVLLVLLLGSLIPPFCTYPIIHIEGVFHILVVSSLLFISLLIGLSSIGFFESRLQKILLRSNSNAAIIEQKILVNS